MTPSPSRSPPQLPLSMEDPDPDRLPHRRPSIAAQPDDTRFPQGQCRYILLVADLKGQRCGCTTFSHNQSMPGVTCDCGHLACFHVKSSEAVSPTQGRDDIELLKRRVQALEQQVDPHSEHHGLGNVVHRLGQLEDTLDKHQEEARNDTKGTYKHISAAWQLVELLQQRLAKFEENQRTQSEQLQRAGKELEDLRNRNLELLEAEEMLEERVEKLEGTETLLSPAPEPSSRSFAVEMSLGLSDNTTTSHRQCSSAHQSEFPLPTPISRRITGPDYGSAPGAEAVTPTVSGSWTIHMSLLPSRRQPFPFEKDTNAYKRLLSRGLLRMVAVGGADAESFRTAVTRAFKGALGGRPWEPLQAQPRDGSRSEGLPALRPLDKELVRRDIDAQFICQYSAVCDINGRPESMYLAVSGGTLSWSTIQALPVYVEGLESSWEHDRELDGDEPEDTELSDKDQRLLLKGGQTPAVRSSSPALKRDLAEMQTSTLASSLRLKGEADSHRAKIARTCMSEMFEVRRELEAAL